MKKFLLLAVAALMVCTANSQPLKRQNTGKFQAKHQVAVDKKATFKQYTVAGEKPGVKAFDKETPNFKGLVNVKDFKPAFEQFKDVRAAGTVLEKYEGSGTLRSSNEAVEWEMYTGTATTDNEETVNVIRDLIPNIFGYENGVTVRYTIEDGNIVIQPTLVATLPSEKAPNGTNYYLFLESATSSDGSITLTLDETGAITGSYGIIYSIYPDEVYNYDDWIATYDGISGAQYSIPGVVKTPEVSFETGNLILFAGLGLNGYSYSSNLAMAGAYAPVNFVNCTADKTTAWQWTAYDADDEEGLTAYATGVNKDFAVTLQGNTVLQNVQLVGINQTAESEPFIFGVGKSKEDDGTAHYENCYIYATGTESDFMLNKETPAIITRQDPDGDLTFYTNWGTPDIYTTTSMSKIYMYHEKPAAPLYITGITLPMVSFSAKEGFNLHIKIQKVSYPAGYSKPVLGEVIAEGDASEENINDNFSAGLTAVEFPLYKEDEDGMSTELDYLFIDDEFMVIVEGWDNGTFSGILGCQAETLDNARTSTWLEKSDEPESMYSYTTWKTSLFIGFLGATYGYLYTEDNTDLTIPATGGEATIHVEPLLVNTDDDDNLLTDLWVEDEENFPEWADAEVVNENYVLNDDGYLDECSFDLKITVEALPDGVEGRWGQMIFAQEGALLKVTVAQGNVDGIKDITSTTASTQKVYGNIYNMAGQRVNANYKGLVVKKGKKYMAK